jgi:hypothetical protein
MTVSGTGSSARACVVYSDNSTGKLMFARASDAQGSDWGSPKVIDGEDGFESGSGPSITNLANGWLAVSSGRRHQNDDDFELRYVYCADTVGQLWLAPVSLTDPQDMIGKETAISLIDGKPAIATSSKWNYDSESSVLYLRSEDMFGAGWGEPQVAVPNDGEMIHAISMTEGDHGAIISFATGADANYQRHIHTKRAVNIDGSGWTNEYIWTIDGVENTAFTHTSNGMPMLAIGGSGLTPGLWNLRGDTDAVNWESFLRDLTPLVPHFGGHVAITQVDNVPAIAFQDGQRKELFYMRALNENGTQWPEPLPVATSGYTGHGCAMVSVDDSPIICFHDSDANTIVAAYIDQII